MDHIKLYNDTALECSKLITKRYSTSFSLGIKTLDPKLHLPIYAIYGFVRYADEIVDTFHEHDKKRHLEQFKKDTYKAIEDKVSFNPVLHSFQLVVNQYSIDHELIEAFLVSMEMDLYKQDYTTEGYKKYIYGSAEVVGLMCLYVFCNGNQKQYDELLPAAKALGSAFQKVNFLRDMKSDFEDRGRVYFPGVDFKNFSQADRAAIEKDIQLDFDNAYQGIMKLPVSARAGVYLAYIYYLRLFDKIKSTPTAKILNERIRIPDAKKAILLFSTYLKFRLG
ncbi:phytoene/squalene synthase family protein [Flammeovirgaceae bacterium SG7u.111]|nr:phytoene/squalene synthase family protein [Flammeovirgaceae bacterium SG7u.132]WPO36200.1 phytoene/squalene synthase family protein [Flammeovirgaceae bacterium SG7u.111]